MQTVAVKCNIAANVTKKVNLSQWGFSIDKDLDRAIVENYMESLGCISISLKSCNDYDDACAKINEQNGSNVDFTCNMNVVGMSYTLDPNPASPEEISFYLAVGDVYGAKQPLTYKWIYDSNKLDIVGTDDQPIVKFKAKVGHDVDYMVTGIQLQVTDANGCKDTKTCYYSAGSMKCNDSFVPCYADSNLQVAYLYVACAKPKTLVVSNV